MVFKNLISRVKSRGLVVIALALTGLAVAGGIAVCRSRRVERVYRIGANDDPPMQSRRPDGNFEGFAYDVVSEAARRAGIRLQWVYAPEGPDETSIRDVIPFPKTARGTSLWLGVY